MPDLSPGRESATPELNMSHEKLKDAPGVVRVRIGCDVEAGNGQEVEKYFNYVLQSEQPRQVLLDLGGVTFGDTAFFSLLLFWNEEVQNGGGKLVVYGVRPELHSTLRLLSFDKFLTIRTDQAAALAALPGQ
jgi:stage II sporulation protein AA (anti-sigma F factor antagonist)